MTYIASGIDILEVIEDISLKQADKSVGTIGAMKLD